MRIIIPRLITLFALAAGIAAAAVEQTDVYVSGQDGYHTYRIPSIVRLADGTLLAIVEGRKTGGGDAGDIDLLVKRSSDSGRTWGKADIIWDDADNTCGNPCAVVDRDTGTIWLFSTHNIGSDRETDIIHKRANGTRTVWVIRSDDNGRTWSKPDNLTAALKHPSWGWYATGPGIGIQIERGPHKGRLVIPGVHSYDDPAGNVREGPYEYGSHSIYSDDHGKTWQLGGVIRPKVNECQLVELANPAGTLEMNMRSYLEKGCRAIARSEDGGLTWGSPADSPALIEPRCQAGILRHAWPENGKPGALLFSNPDSKTAREQLTIRLSGDDGATWPRALVLHKEFSAYSCLVSLSADEAGCLYEAGGKNRKQRYQRITFARFSIKDIQ
jgi:sialidase-1